MMQTVFGLPLPLSDARPIPRDLADALAARMALAATRLQTGPAGALAAGVRQDAQRYLAARRSGALRLPGATARRCDESALALLQLTVDAVPILPTSERLVA